MMSISHPEQVAGFLFCGRAARLTLAGLATGALWVGTSGTGLAQSVVERPNIILIMADDLGREKLGCYGAANYQTPQLDQLAAQGMRFERANANPICTPSRVQLLTGRFTHRNYAGFGQFPLTGPGASNEVTFAQILRSAGYATFGTGKWQLDQSIPINMGHLGFTEYVQRRNPGGNYYASLFDTHSGPFSANATTYTEDVSSTRIMEFITRHQDRPFLVYYPMYLVHAPLTEPPPGTPAGPAGTEYCAEMVAYMDTIVGRIVDHVDALGLGNRTLILFTGDNGSAKTSIMQDGSTHPGGKGSMERRSMAMETL